MGKFRSSSVGNMGVDFTEVTESDQWVEVAADRLILMAMIWNFRVNKKTQGKVFYWKNLSQKWLLIFFQTLKSVTSLL